METIQPTTRSAFSWGTASASPEEARIFLRQRLALFALVVFVLSGLLDLRDALEACEAAGRWNHHDAQEWWDEYADALSQLRTEARESMSAGTDTMAIDLGHR